MLKKTPKVAPTVDAQAENASKPAPAPIKETPPIEEQEIDPPKVMLETPPIEEQETDPKVMLVNALKPPALKVDLKNIDKDKLDMAEKFGVPIKGILDYFSEMQSWQTNMSQVLVTVAEVSGKAVTFVNQLEEAQKKIAVQQKQMQAQQQTQPQQQAPPPSGNALMNLLPEIMNMMKGNTQAQAPSNLLGTKVQEFLEKKLNLELENMLNPQPSITEKIGEKILLDYASKKAAQAVGSIT